MKPNFQAMERAMMIARQIAERIDPAYNDVPLPPVSGGIPPEYQQGGVVDPNTIKELGKSVISAINKGRAGLAQGGIPDFDDSENSPQIGINVRSDKKAGLRYADEIVDGNKTYETRDTDSLRPYIGKRVAIVRTGEGPAKAIGEVTIGKPIIADKDTFHRMRDQHLVPAGSAFDIKPDSTKHLYPMHDPIRYDNERDVSTGIVARKVLKRAQGGGMSGDMYLTDPEKAIRRAMMLSREGMAMGGEPPVPPAVLPEERSLSSLRKPPESSAAASLRLAREMKPESPMVRGQEVPEAAVSSPVAPDTQATPIPKFDPSKYASRFFTTERAAESIQDPSLADPIVNPLSARGQGAQHVETMTKRGEAIQPLLPHPSPEEMQSALADTRVGADIVADRLNKIVPERDRVAGGVYVPGAPNGGRWSDLGEEFLNKPGKGFNLSEQDIDQMWQDAVAQSSQAAKNAVAQHDVKPTFRSKNWDEAMKLPLKDHLWYELSGEKFSENLPDLSGKEHMHLMDLVGATSARADPYDNLLRSMAALSQSMRGVPVDIDLTQPSTVRAALARKGAESSALPGNKTGHFSDTLALTGGIPTRFPISVNDVWVGDMFGINDQVMSQNQSLHEPMAIYFNKMRDLYNERMDPEFTYQSWNFQAPGWVKLRQEKAGAETGDAYHQVWDKMIDRLKAADIPGISGSQITRDALMHPDFADALRPTARPVREAKKATVEFGTTQTDIGSRAKELYDRAVAENDPISQQEYLKSLTTAMYSSARGKGHAWERLKKAITGDLTQASDITRIESPVSTSPLDIGGTFEAALSPNIRVPLKGMNDEQIGFFNAVAGKHLRQDAMAASTFMPTDPAQEPREDHIRGFSAFIPTTEQMSPSDIREFAKELHKEGHDLSYARYPNGYKFDVIPKFTDEGAEGISHEKLADAYDKSLKSKYGEPKLMAHDFSSVYNPAEEYDSLRQQLVERIENEFVEQAISAGADENQARAALAQPQVPDYLSSRGRKAWDTYRRRLDHLASSEKGFQEIAQRVNDAHAGFIDRAQKRFERAEKARGKKTKQPEPTAGMASGGIVDRALRVAAKARRQ